MRPVMHCTADPGSPLDGVTHIPYEGDLRALVTKLGQQGINRALIEGGGVLAAAFIAADLVDELVQFTGGCLIGDDGRPSIDEMGIDQLKDAPRFRLASFRHLGHQTLAYWRRER